MGMNKRETKMSQKNSFINSSRGFESTKKPLNLYWDKDGDQEEKKKNEEEKEEEGGRERNLM